MARDRVRNFLMLAKTYEAARHGRYIGGWYMSEKLDGLRAYWDGGITRGLYCGEVPFANLNKGGDDRRASGLWTRLGKPIHAPDDFLDGLPEFPLDGELWAGRGEWESASSIVRTYDGLSVDWSRMQYMVFESPHSYDVFAPGRINDTHFKIEITPPIRDWVHSRQKAIIGPITDFGSTYNTLLKIAPTLKSQIRILDQEKLPTRLGEAAACIEERLDAITALGGEGLMLRNPGSTYESRRIDGLLKVKRLVDDEAQVVGWTWGRETVLGSRLLGKMGALIVNWNGLIFELSGFTDSEREMAGPAGSVEIRGQLMAGEEETDTDRWHPQHFRLGEMVTFKYMGLTRAGIPKSAQYFRKPL